MTRKPRRSQKNSIDGEMLVVSKYSSYYIILRLAGIPPSSQLPEVRLCLINTIPHFPSYPASRFVSPPKGHAPVVFRLFSLSLGSLYKKGRNHVRREWPACFVLLLNQVKSSSFPPHTRKSSQLNRESMMILLKLKLYTRYQSA